jgi:hypothetical protein
MGLGRVKTLRRTQGRDVSEGGDRRVSPLGAQHRKLSLRLDAYVRIAAINRLGPMMLMTLVRL